MLTKKICNKNSISIVKDKHNALPHLVHSVSYERMRSILPSYFVSQKRCHRWARIDGPY